MNNICKEIFELAKKDKKINPKRFNKIKSDVLKKYHAEKVPSNIEIASALSEQERREYKNFLTIKPMRTASGVSVIAIMTKPIKCPHGKCIMCPGGPKSSFGNVPQSYTGREPASLRAVRNEFDSYLQVFNRLEQYAATNKSCSKIELIIMGGTFPSFPKKYQDEFIMYAFKAMNDFGKIFFDKEGLRLNKFLKFFELPGDIHNTERINRIKEKTRQLKSKSTLKREQAKNQKARIRCVGLTIETRPDYATLEHAYQMLNLGATRVELGVQTVYNDVLEKIERGHSVGDTIKATQLLKDFGFKINYHMMPGLPGVTRKQDLDALKRIFISALFRPDMLKIYPCMVLKDTKLFDEWKKGRFKPLNAENAAELIAEFKQYVPEYVRIMRVQRDIPTLMTEAGVEKTNLRQEVHKLMSKKGIKCRCIRCRESGNAKGKWTIKQMSYDASNGTEFFISAEQDDKVLGFCRMRFPSQSLRKEITENSALIRELHVYGEPAHIGEKGNVQHRGIGKQLLATAEKIARQHKKDKIVVISGIGVRDYYRKQGYKREGIYMTKKIVSNSKTKSL